MGLRGHKWHWKLGLSLLGFDQELDVVDHFSLFSGITLLLNFTVKYVWFEDLELIFGRDVLMSDFVSASLEIKRDSFDGISPSRTL